MKSKTKEKKKTLPISKHSCIISTRPESETIWNGLIPVTIQRTNNRFKFSFFCLIVFDTVVRREDDDDDDAIKLVICF